MQTTKVMTNVKRIIVNSPKHGQQIILVDSQDYDLVKDFTWCVNSYQRGTTLYALSSRWLNNKPNTFSMHRFLMNPSKGFVIDHINGNGLDNRRINLRICSQKENSRNSSKSKNNTTGYKGVCYKKDHGRIKRFKAYIKVEFSQKSLGYYNTAIEAAKAYNEAALKYFGQYACLNPLPNE